MELPHSSHWIRVFSKKLGEKDKHMRMEFTWETNLPAHWQDSQMRLCPNYVNTWKWNLIGYFIKFSSTSCQRPVMPGEKHIFLYPNISWKRAHHRLSMSFVTDMTDLYIPKEVVRKEPGGLWSKRMNSGDTKIWPHTSSIWYPERRYKLLVPPNQVFLANLNPIVVLSHLQFCPKET